MSKLNPTKKSTSSFSEEVLAGGAGMKAAKQDNISLLKRVVLANLLWENNAYIDGESVSNEISRLIPLCSPKEVAQLAIDARILQKLRHTPLFICVEMLKHKEHALLVKEILPRIITRADMITDFVAIYKKQNGGKTKPISNSAKLGLAKSFENFDEYHFAKYDRDSEIKLRDVMFLVHPKPIQGREELYKKIASRTLAIPDTWEVALSTGKDKKETWTRLITEGKLGVLALLRNIRNMKEANVDKKIITTGLQSIKSQRLLPLNFLSSARINPEFEREIEDAMIKSYETLPKLPGKTLFIVDISGSMGQLTSGNSKFSRLDQACAMAMLAVNQCEDYEIVATAGNDTTSIGADEHITYPKKGFGLFGQLNDSRKRIGQGGIFTRQCLEWCKENIKKDFDRIIVFSDSQDCDKVNRTPQPYAKNNYIIDVSAEKNGVNFKGKWTAEISGWSEHFITYIAAAEGLVNSFVEE
jgi:60 kDa SS-A/Ro ribonucleoprotein